jgi:hypothetical protein
MLDRYPDQLRTIMRAHDVDALDSWAREVGTFMTNVSGACEMYLEGGFKRSKPIPVWRKYRLTRRPPFLRRKTFSEFLREALAEQT